jgi:hypothetical protein
VDRLISANEKSERFQSSSRKCAQEVALSVKLNSWSQIALKPFDNNYLHKQDLGQAEGEKAYIPNLKNGDHSMMISEFCAYRLSLSTNIVISDNRLQD